MKNKGAMEDTESQNTSWNVPTADGLHIYGAFIEYSYVLKSMQQKEKKKRLKKTEALSCTAVCEKKNSHYAITDFTGIKLIYMEIACSFFCHFAPEIILFSHVVEFPEKFRLPTTKHHFQHSSH